MAKKTQPDYANEPPSPLTPLETHAEPPKPEWDKQASEPRKPKKKPVTQQEVFDEETRIVRLLLKRISRLPDEKSRVRVLNRVYELRDFPLLDQPKEPT